MNLYQKIVEVRKIARGFEKDGKGFNYKYVKGDQILSKIRDKMNELNLLLIPSTKLGEHHTHSYVTAKGKEVTDFVVSGEMSYTWINGDKPDEVLKVDWAYYGQMDELSRAYGSALTYSERYFLLKCLGLPTDEDDPDAKEGYGEEVKPYPVKEVQAPPRAVKPVADTQNVKDVKELIKGNKDELKCSGCGVEITGKVADYSTEKYGKALCMKCQKGVK